MSTAGSASNGEPIAAGSDSTAGRRRRRVRVVRWEGLIPATLILALIGLGWLVFGGRIVASTVEEAGSKALGAAVYVDGAEIHERRATVELRGLAIADPFDPYRNLVEAGVLRVELEPEPLLERKIIVRRLVVRDVRTGTRRRTPARRVGGDGFAPKLLSELDRWSKQFQVPLLSLTPIDTIRSLVLDPTQLRSVQAGLALAQRTDSVRRAVETAYAALRVRETLDTARAIAARLQGANLRTLGITGLRGAVADVRRAIAEVDSARRRVEALERGARGGLEALQAGVRAIDDARRTDYEFARGLLKLPTFDAPQIGEALFGRVTIDKFERALYWTALAREYAPPGLLPRETAGPRRLRQSGTTVHFVEREELPRILVRQAAIDLTLAGGAGRGKYTLAVVDATTEPALIGRPARFALRRDAEGSAVASIRASGLLDHTVSPPRDAVLVSASGIRLPAIPLPVLPFRAEPGNGTSELRLSMTGDQLSGRWVLRSGDLAWRADSARGRALNTIESLVARVITGVRDLDLTAELSGTLTAPKLSVRSNLDRAIATRVREVAGEEIEKAMAKARAHVDRIVEEQTAPIRARALELRADADRRIAEARARLDEERQKLDAELKRLVPRL